MKKPVLTIIFIILNVIIYLFTLLVGSDLMFSAFGMYQGAVANNEGYRLITASFIHSNLIHIGSNMICMYYFGKELECNINRFKYLLILIICILSSGYFINYFGGNAIHGGASGIVFGLFTATFILEYNIGKDYTHTLYALIMNLIFSFGSGISWQGHIGGLIGGLIAGYLFCKKAETISLIEWKKLHPTCSVEYYYRNR